MSFRRGERRDGSRFTYPLSGRGEGGYVPRELEVERRRGPEVFNVSTGDSIGNEEFLINQALNAPSGASYCPIAGRLLPKITISDDDSRIRVDLRFPGRYAELQPNNVEGAIHVVGRLPSGVRETQSWSFLKKDLRTNPATRELFLSAVGKRVHNPLIRMEE